MRKSADKRGCGETDQAGKKDFLVAENISQSAIEKDEGTKISLIYKDENTASLAWKSAYEKLSGSKKFLDFAITDNIMRFHDKKNRKIEIGQDSNSILISIFNE